MTINKLPATKASIKRWLKLQALTAPVFFRDSAGCWISTSFAEVAAHNWQRYDWLDDETHWIWDVAVEVADWALAKQIAGCKFGE